MKTREELKQEYKERKKEAGIFCVRNTVTGRILLGSSLNLDGPLNGHRFMLSIGTHRNEALQADWNKYGPEAFTFEILEKVRMSEDPLFNVNDELTLLEEIWIEKLQPFSGNGYNSGTRIRQA